MTILAIAMFVATAVAEEPKMAATDSPGGCEVAAYYFPSYHSNPQYSGTHSEGWTEWDLLKAAGPRFAGHKQPKVPAWGYEDESDSAVMARKIDAAADNGLSAFIFDWYWHDSGPFLERGLDKGFLGAKNNERLKFAVMWANHDWINIFPAKAGKKAELVYPGAVTRETFEKATQHCIDVYFKRPNYWRVGGGAYFSIYEMMTLISGLGGVEKTREALDDFRARCKAAGCGDLHLNAVMWGIQLLPNERAVANPVEMIGRLGIDSVSSYCWIHHVAPATFPTYSYADWSAKSTALWPEFVKKWPVPYYPNVSMGWDSSPRTTQSDAFENVGYPFTSVLVDNSPELFKKALYKARAFLATQPKERRILSINAWNEWTEGSYLEPDTEHGMGYLEAVKEVFGRRP